MITEHGWPDPWMHAVWLEELAARRLSNSSGPEEREYAADLASQAWIDRLAWEQHGYGPRGEEASSCITHFAEGDQHE